jgi:CRISPR system Cascade subunit CasD
MPEFLTFQLAAPIAAMGELAVGERRGSWERPGRSAVLGLIAGCLGLDRADEAAHLALEQGYGLALRVERPGGVLADYHTAQVPPARRNRRFATRAEELAAPDLNTILSRRDYRTDLLAFGALWPRGDTARWSLAHLAAALRAPGFTPYLGRKSCPLMLPLAPELHEAAEDDPVALLGARAAAFATWARAARMWPLLRQTAAVVTLDEADARRLSYPVQRVELRRDRIASRRRWQFGLREEAVLLPS